jgi:hypothetical protein
LGQKKEGSKDTGQYYFGAFQLWKTLEPVGHPAFLTDLFISALFHLCNTLLSFSHA